MFKKEEEEKVLFGKKAKKKLLKEAEPLYKAVSTTLGAGGRNVIFKDGFAPVTITKDGIQVARNFNSAIDISMGAELLRDASERTNKKAGDGTTSTIVLGYELLKNGINLIDKKSNPIKIKKGIDIALEDITKELDIMSKKGNLFDVAMVSSNGDKEISDLVVESFNHTGVDGLVGIVNGKTGESFVEKESGIVLDNGWMSPHYAGETGIVEYQNPLILVIDDKIDKIDKIIYFLKYCFDGKNNRKSRPLIVIANQLTNPVQNFLVANITEYKMPIVAVKSPLFSEKRTTIMSDIAAITGGKVISESFGNLVDMGIKSKGSEEDKVNSCEFVLGSCKRIIITKDKTVIFPDNPVDEYVDNIPESSWSKERKAILSGNMATITVGANSEVEQKERYMRLEDCVNTVRSAMSEGVVVGAGMSLVLIKNFAYKRPSLDRDTLNGYNLLYSILDSVALKIIDNAGLNKRVLIESLDRKSVFNLNTGEFEKFEDTIIIDATITIKSALKNAASVIGTLLTTECLFYK